MSSIRLHRDYGLNPTIPQCFWCGKQKGEVALLGAGYREQAPISMVLDYVPCGACQENMGLGIACLEVTAKPKDRRPPLAPEGALSVAYPTGRWVVIKEDALERMAIPDAMKEQVLLARRTLMDPGTFDILFGEIAKEGV